MSQSVKRMRALSEPDEQEHVAAPLTSVQAQALRSRVALLQASTVIWTQVVVAVLFAVVAVVFAGLPAMYSALYGAFCIVLPNIVLLRGLYGALARVNALGGLLGFLVWEGVKLVLAIVLLGLAPRAVQLWGTELMWIWLLLGLIVAAKSIWLALWWSRRNSA